MLSRAWVIVLRKYDFILLRALNDRSEFAFESGNTKRSLKNGATSSMRVFWAADSAQSAYLMFATDGATDVVDINNWRIVASFANKHSLSKSPSQNVHTFYMDSL